MGADEMSCTFLRALVSASDIDVAGVITQPDKKKGRHMNLSPGPVKELAVSLCKPCFTPLDVNTSESLADIRGLHPDVIVVMAYGQFLGKELLFSVADLGCLNMHVSILPKFRGAAPIQRAIMEGESETGVSAMLMDEGMDTGDILGVVKTPIFPDDTTGILQQRLAPMGAELMLNVIRMLRDGTAVRIPQDNTKATKARKIRKSEAFIEWSKPADELARLVRAMNPKPCCQTFLPPQPDSHAGEYGPLLKIFEARVESRPPNYSADISPGTVMEMRKGPLVATGAGGALRLLKVRPEGGTNIMSGMDFSNGYGRKVPVGSRFRSIGYSSFSNGTGR